MTQRIPGSSIPCTGKRGALAKCGRRRSMAYLTAEVLLHTLLCLAAQNCACLTYSSRTSTRKTFMDTARHAAVSGGGPHASFWLASRKAQLGRNSGLDEMGVLEATRTEAGPQSKNDTYSIARKKQTQPQVQVLGARNPCHCRDAQRYDRTTTHATHSPGKAIIGTR